MIFSTMPQAAAGRGRRFSSPLRGGKQNTGVSLKDLVGTGLRGPKFPCGSSGLDL